MNTPNKISVFRLILVPILVLIKLFPYAQFNLALNQINVGHISIPVIDLIILLIFIVGSVSDFLDGYLARKNNLVTTFGKFIDPIADKALTTTLFVLLAIEGRIPAFVVLIFIWRDILVDGMRMIAADKGIVVSAGLLGKAKTVVQMLCIIFILLNNLPFELIGLSVSNFLLWLAVLLSVFSGIDYYQQTKEYIYESK